MIGCETTALRGEPTAQASRCERRVLFTWVFLLVLTAQLALVAIAGTDIPFHDQWNIEGQWLYPAWREGSLSGGDLLRPFNEHRIAWTLVLNLGLFAMNGQWDPLVQMAVIAVLRAACAAGIVSYVARGATANARLAAGAATVVAFLPHLAWHNVLWGIESHAYFALGFSMIALGLLGASELSARRVIAGLTAGIAGLFAMGPAALVPVALIGLTGLRAIERRKIDRVVGRQLWPATVLLLLALLLRAHVPEHTVLRAEGLWQFASTAMRMLAWPHVNMPIAAVAINLPLLLVVLGRLLQRRVAVRGEDFVLLVGGWSAAVGLATAWMRGGSAELSVGVPSRYVDFIVLLPLANIWCVVVLACEAVVRWKGGARLLAGAWGAFLLLGWLGLSAEVMRGLVLPRMRDREAPVRLARAFQMSGDASIFAGQPRLLVPHPNLESVHAVMNDPRLRGALPPSLQPEEPLGPLSRSVRTILGR